MIPLTDVRFVHGVKMPNGVEKNGIVNSRVVGGNEAPPVYEMWLSIESRLVVIRHIASGHVVLVDLAHVKEVKPLDAEAAMLAVDGRGSTTKAPSRRADGEPLVARRLRGPGPVAATEALESQGAATATPVALGAAPVSP